MDADTAMENLADYPTLLREVGQLQTLVGKPRRHILTYADTYAPGEARAVPLPRELTGGWTAFRLPTGPKPAGMRVEIRLGFDGTGLKEVRLNGEPCVVDGLRLLPKPRSSGEALIFLAPLKTVARGANVVEVMGTGKMHWVEIAFI